MLHCQQLHGKLHNVRNGLGTMQGQTGINYLTLAGALPEFPAVFRDKTGMAPCTGKFNLPPFRLHHESTVSVTWSLDITVLKANIGVV